MQPLLVLAGALEEQEDGRGGVGSGTACIPWALHLPLRAPSPLPWGVQGHLQVKTAPCSPSPCSADRRVCGYLRSGALPHAALPPHPTYLAA